MAALIVSLASGKCWRCTRIRICSILEENRPFVVLEIMLSNSNFMG